MRIGQVDRLAIEGNRAPGEANSQTPRSGRPLWILLGVLLCAVVAAEFWPLLGGDFCLDEYVRLYDLENYGLTKLLLSPHGGHLLTTSNATYAVLAAAFGLEPRWWFATLLVVHVSNTLLLIRFLARLGCASVVALAFGAAWALCLVQSGSLGWFAVSGHVLAGTAMLLVLGDMARAAARQGPMAQARVLWWSVLGLVTATSFAVGLAIAALLPAFAMCLFADEADRRRVVQTLAFLVAAIPALYVGQHSLYARLFDVPALFPAPNVLSLQATGNAIAQAASLFPQLVAYGVGVLLLGPLVDIQFGGVAVGPWRGVSAAALLAALRLPVLALLAGATVACGRGRVVSGGRRWDSRSWLPARTPCSPSGP